MGGTGCLRPHNALASQELLYIQQGPKRRYRHRIEVQVDTSLQIENSRANNIRTRDRHLQSRVKCLQGTADPEPAPGFQKTSWRIEATETYAIVMEKRILLRAFLQLIGMMEENFGQVAVFRSRQHGKDICPWQVGADPAKMQPGWNGQGDCLPAVRERPEMPRSCCGYRLGPFSCAMTVASSRFAHMRHIGRQLVFYAHPSGRRQKAAVYGGCFL
jgi:hypothetical protein